jgi:hypothetical protein
MEEIKELTQEEKIEQVNLEIIQNEISKYTIQSADVEKVKEYKNLKITDIKNKDERKAVAEAKKITRNNRLSIQRTTKMIDERIKGIKSKIHETSDGWIKDLEEVEEHLELQEAWVEQEILRIEEEEERQRQIFLQGRIKQMTDAGMIFDGAAYTYGEHTLEAHKIAKYDAVLFNVMITNVKESTAADKLKAEEERIAREKAEADEKERKRLAEEKLEEERQRLQKIADDQAEQGRKLKEDQDKFAAEQKRIADENAAALKKIQDDQAALEAQKKAAETSKVEEIKVTRPLIPGESVYPSRLKVEDIEYVKPTPESFVGDKINPVIIDEIGLTAQVPSQKIEEPVKASPIKEAYAEAHKPMPSPSAADQQSPLFNGIWEVLKDWDIAAPQYYTGYTGGNGSHVMLIIQGMRAKFDELGLKVSIQKKN